MAEIEDVNDVAANNNQAAPEGLPEGMNPSGVNDSVRELMAKIKRWFLYFRHGEYVATGTNAYTLSPVVTPVDGYIYHANFANANTAASTLSGDPIQDRSGNALIGGEINGSHRVKRSGSTWVLLDRADLPESIEALQNQIKTYEGSTNANAGGGNAANSLPTGWTASTTFQGENLTVVHNLGVAADAYAVMVKPRAVITNNSGNLECNLAIADVRDRVYPVTKNTNDFEVDCYTLFGGSPTPAQRDRVPDLEFILILK